MSYWLLDWQYLIGWQDNQRLIIAAPGYPAGNFLILNPFTRQKEVLSIDLNWTETYWDTAIIALQTHRAYRLVENGKLFAWMKKPK